MEDTLKHKDFIEGMKEKRLRLLFNPLSTSLWKAPLPQKYWVILGLSITFSISIVFLSFPLIMFFGTGAILVSIILAFGSAYLTRKYLYHYLKKCALQSEEFYNFGINEGTFIVETVKK
jgi:hypothetical protein